MLKKKRFQRDNWMGRTHGRRQQREQKLFAVTIAVALVIMAVALGLSKTNTSFHLPFGRSASATP